MKPLFKAFKTTILGGIVFLAPVAIGALLGAKIWEIMTSTVRPFEQLLSSQSVLGIAAVNLLAIGLTVLLCFVAGLIARSVIGARIYAFVDTKLLAAIPQYAFAKSMLHGTVQQDIGSTLQPVLVRFDDAMQIGFLSDGAPVGNLATVFVPGAPDPWSGSVMYIEPDRLVPLEAEFPAVIRHLRRLGHGASSVLEKRPQ